METLDTWSVSVASSESLCTERLRDAYTNYAGNGSSINTREDVPVSFVYLQARASNTQPSLKSNSTSSIGRNAIYSSDSFDEFLSSIGDSKETTGSRPLPRTASQLLLAEIVTEEAHCRDGRHKHESARDGGHAFPTMLYRMLEENRFSDIVSWKQDGQCFIIESESWVLFLRMSDGILL